MDRSIALFANDPPLLSSLRFSLSLDGFGICDTVGAAARAACMVIDQDFRGDGLAWLGRLRASGNSAPAIILVTHPDRAARASATELGARLIDKPLMGDELAEALAIILNHRPAAECSTGRRHQYSPS